MPPLHPRCRCAIMYRELKEQTKPQSISTKDCKTFSELEKYWQSNYNVKILPAVNKLYFESVREAFSGFETAVQLLPQAAERLNTIGVAGGKNLFLEIRVC